MDAALAILIVLAAVVVGIGLSTVVLVFASSLAASKPLDARQALLIVLVAGFVNTVVQGVAGVVGLGLLAGVPGGLAVWTLVISWIGQLRLGESFITAVVMNVLQFVAALGLALVLVAVGLGLGGMQ